MSSEFGKNIKVSIFGESHGIVIGAVIDGFPAGEEIDEKELSAFMERRAPGRAGALATPRKESDELKIFSGIYKKKTTGAPVCVTIENKDMRSSDYEKNTAVPRPGHADFTAWVKYSNHADMRGGGHFSGRLTAPLCAAGGIALQILKKRGIVINARLISIGNETDLNDIRIEKIINDLNGDSVGGVIECVTGGVPCGLGGGMFGLESKLAYALFGIPAVKGVEFGSGFEAGKKRGSQNNDAFLNKDGKIITKTNRHGGILGGISTGMPIVFKAAMKPTPSITIEQNSVDLNTLESVKLKTEGRHDPCVAIRAVPVMEAVTALVILDALIDYKGEKI